MMKLSALLTWIVGMAFTMVTTSAVPKCTIDLAGSGCNSEDVDKVVEMLNMKFKKNGNRKDRVLNQEDILEESATGLRGAAAAVQSQEDRELYDCGWCYRNCPSPCSIVMCVPCYRRRDLQQSVSFNNADELGQSIKSNLGTFGWNSCNPSNFLAMDCKEV